MKPLAAAAVAAPALEVEAFGVVADEEIVALIFIRDVDGIMRRGAADMRLARGVEIRFVTLGTADGTFDDKQLCDS